MTRQRGSKHLSDLWQMGEISLCVVTSLHTYIVFHLSTPISFISSFQYLVSALQFTSDLLERSSLLKPSLLLFSFVSQHVADFVFNPTSRFRVDRLSLLLDFSSTFNSWFCFFEFLLVLWFLCSSRRSALWGTRCLQCVGWLLAPSTLVFSCSVLIALFFSKRHWLLVKPPLVWNLHWSASIVLRRSWLWCVLRWSSSFSEADVHRCER